MTITSIRALLFSMQTRVLQIKLRVLNRGKAERLAKMQHAFTASVRLHLEAAYRLPKPSVKSLHDACYRQARSQFALPASTIQQARVKALSIYRSVRAKRRKNRQAFQTQSLWFHSCRRVLRLKTCASSRRATWRASPHPTAFCGSRSRLRMFRVWAGRILALMLGLQTWPCRPAPVLFGSSTARRCATPADASCATARRCNASSAW